MNHRKILLFLGITYGITWATFAALEQMSSSDGGLMSVLLTILYRWGPAIAAIYVARQVYRSPLKFPPLDSMAGRWFFLALAWAASLALGTLLLVWLGGNVLELPLLGRLDWSTDELINRLSTDDNTAAAVPAWFGDLPGGVIFAMMFFIQFLLGTTLYIAYTYGEEIGWRGFLLRETRPMGFWGGNLLVGLFAGIWHIPFLVTSGLEGIHLMTGLVALLLFHISLAFPLAYFVEKSGHFITAAAVQGVLTALAGTLQLFMVEGHHAIASLLGGIGILLCLVSAWLIAHFDPNFVDQYQAEKIED